MAYIGRDIEYGSFTKQTLTANSSTTVFALDQSVLDAKSLLVSVGGVIQEPDVAYTASGTTLTFTGTPVTGDPIWIVYLGKTLGTSSARGAITYQTATGDGSATTVAMTSTGTTGTIIVTLNGVMQTPSTDFSVSGSTLTFTTAPFSGAAIGIYYVSKKAKLAVPAADSIQVADLAAGGTLPAWDGGNLTGIVSIMKSDILEMQNNIALLNFLRSNDSTTKRMSMLNGFNDMFRNATGVDMGVNIPMVRFNSVSSDVNDLGAYSKGLNGYLSSGFGNMVGAVSTKSLLFSFILDKKAGDGKQQQISDTTSGKPQIDINSANKLHISARTTGNTLIFDATYNTTLLTVAGGLYRVIINLDFANQTHQVYINDVLQSATVSTAMANAEVGFGGVNNAIGHNQAGGFLYQGDIGRFYVAQENLDLSVVANRRKFFDANNNPVDMGANGELPTGNKPLIYLNNPAATFATNLGTGTITGNGNSFNMTGQLIDSGYLNLPDSDALYSSNSFTNSYELIDSYSISNQTSQSNLYSDPPNGSNHRNAQSITFASAITVTKMAIFTKKLGSPTGNAYLSIAGVTGTPGTNAVPDDNIIARSDALNVGSLTTSFGVSTFSFAEPVSLSAGNYSFILEYSGGNSSNYFRVGMDTSSPTHAGTFAQKSPLSGTSWAADNNIDMCFYLYGSSNLDLITKGTDSLAEVSSPSSAPTKGHLEVLVDENPVSGTSVWTANNTLDSNGWTGISIRQIILGSDISAGGDKIRITLQGNSANTGEYDNVSIVERSGTSSGTTTPTEILFGGASGIAIPSSNGTVVSDWFDYTIDASKSYLICMDVISNAAKDDFVINVSTGAGYYWSLNTNSYNTTSLGGSITFVPNRTHTISKIETSVKPTINTDIIGEISRDGGTTYSPAVLSRIPKVINGSDYEILAGDVDFTGDPSGTNLVGRIRTVNKHKVTVNGIAVNWI